MAQQSPNPLKTKQHFEILDGLRGVAALVVVIFHFMEFATPNYNNNFIAHGYLAVDFFFCLSGFVIAYAYDNRIKKIGFFQFIRLRLIRLHPLVLIGAILGLLSFVYDPFSNLFAQYGLDKTILMFLSSSLLIPYPAVPERYYNFFHLNPPIWSLFWEYIANIFYALILYKLRNKLLWLLIILAAIFLLYMTYPLRSLGVKWYIDILLNGGARVFYSFLAGMLVYRSGWIIKTSIGFVSMSLLLVIAFLFSYSDSVRWPLESGIVIIYFPLLIALGAGASLAPPLRKICNFSGSISYPLYIVHYPFLWLFLSYMQSEKPTIYQLEFIIPISVILLVVLAYAVMRFLDIPIRNYLKRV